MTSYQKYFSSCLLMSAALLCSFSPGVAQTAPDLDSAGNFTVLAGTAVTCTTSTVDGDVGGPVVTQTLCTVNGTVHINDAAVTAANLDREDAYAELAATACTTTFGSTLNGLPPLPPGVYCFPAGATGTGATLTLVGDADDVWIFKVGTEAPGALTATNFTVVFEGGGEPCNVYWWVDAAATLTDSNFAGNILAGAAITITRGTLSGAAYADTAVTLTDTSVTGCDPGVDPPDDPPHFTCFDLTTAKGDIKQAATLITQFGKSKVHVKNAKLLCAPTIKKRFCTTDKYGEETCNEVTQADLDGFHLLCWTIAPSYPAVRKQVMLDSQFGDTYAKVETPSLLCEPVMKELKPPKNYRSEQD